MCYIASSILHAEILVVHKFLEPQTLLPLVLSCQNLYRVYPTNVSNWKPVFKRKILRTNTCVAKKKYDHSFPGQIFARRTTLINKQCDF